MDTKLCCICNEVKPATTEFFHKRGASEDGYRCDCKECRRLKKKKNYNTDRKICTKCKIEYPNNSMYFNNLDSIIVKTRAICRNCHKKTSRKSHLKRKYNLTLEEFENLKIQQSNKCIICNNTPKRFVVDHNHTTGSVRGLLCDNCNSGIGMFKENTEYMKKAIEYINHHSKETN